jgi:hypothetical protein
VDITVARSTAQVHRTCKVASKWHHKELSTEQPWKGRQWASEFLWKTDSSKPHPKDILASYRGMSSVIKANLIMQICLHWKWPNRFKKSWRASDMLTSPLRDSNGRGAECLWPSGCEACKYFKHNFAICAKERVCMETKDGQGMGCQSSMLSHRGSKGLWTPLSVFLWRLWGTQCVLLPQCWEGAQGLAHPICHQATSQPSKNACTLTQLLSE